MVYQISCSTMWTRLELKIFPWPLSSSLEVPFPSSREATIALRSLSPDREPRKGGIEKQLTLSGSTLSVWETRLVFPSTTSISACSAKLLLCLFQEVASRWSADPPSVRELVPGSSFSGSGNHGDVWTPSVKHDTCFRTCLTVSFSLVWLSKFSR